MPRRVVEIANLRRYGETCTSLARAEEYCARGLAYRLRDGRLKFRDNTPRENSDVDVDRRGVIWWNGARSHFDPLDRDLAMFTPGCNVLFPTVDSRRASRRYR
jgi:hypothetical protein